MTPQTAARESIARIAGATGSGTGRHLKFVYVPRVPARRVPLDPFAHDLDRATRTGAFPAVAA
jgi:hypothetical protein